MKNTAKDALIQSVAFLLRPLVRLMLAHGISFREFVDISKRTFFDVGNDVIEESHGKKTDSQLSVLTGLHRKDITTFRKTKRKPAQKNFSPGAAIIAEWLTNPRYVGKGGTPRVLSYAGEENSFTALVESVSKDIRAKSYLEELLRLNLVEMEDAHRVRLKQEGFLPSGDFSQKLDFFRRQVGDHLSAAVANMQQAPSPFFDRSMFHDKLTAEQVREIRRILDTQGMDLLKSAYRRAEETSVTASNAEKPDRRVTVGLYMFDQETSHDDE